MVAIVFRTSGAWGAGQGFNLTAVQVDTNFYNLKTAVEAIQTTPPTAVSIASFEIVGNDLYIHMTDSSVQGPFTLPSTTYTPQGAWQPSTAYVVNDLVSVGGSLYVVTWPHTSASTFDPNANDGAGHNFYQLMFTAPGNSLPTGGLDRQVLGKLSTSDFDVGWLTGLVPNGGAAGAYLTKSSNADQDLFWFTPANTLGSLPIRTISTSPYTFAVADVGSYLRFTLASAIQLFIPTNASVPIAVGSEITFMMTQATSVFISTSGVTVNVPTGFQLTPFGPGAVVTIKKVALNIWDAFGLLKPA
jgi:carbohydrate binding protein with CBM5/12 domain